LKVGGGRIVPLSKPFSGIGAAWIQMRYQLVFEILSGSWR